MHFRIFADGPGDDNLTDVEAVGFGNRGQPGKGGIDFCDVFGGESRTGKPEIARVVAPVRVEFTGQQPVGQRRIGEKTDIVFSTCFQDAVAFGLPVQQAEFFLIDVERFVAAIGLQLIGTDVRAADGEDFPFFFEREQGVDRIVERRGRILPVRLQDIDPVGSEASQALFDFLAN